MSLYVLSDTHLSLSVGKPMDVFGERWKDHAARIERFARSTLTGDDTLVIPGDVSWAMTLEEALADFRFLDALPGKKILGKGNHDYWWSTLTKIETFFKKQGLSTLSLLFNNAYEADGVAVCGTRGWFTDSASPSGTDRSKIVAREAGRLKRSLEAGKATGASELIAFMHFPPFFGDFVCREFIDIMHGYGVKRCYYGHMHGIYGIPPVSEFEGISFIISSGDYLQFRPLRIDREDKS